MNRCLFELVVFNWNILRASDQSNRLVEWSEARYDVLGHPGVASGDGLTCLGRRPVLHRHLGSQTFWGTRRKLPCTHNTKRGSRRIVGNRVEVEVCMTSAIICGFRLNRGNETGIRC